MLPPAQEGRSLGQLPGALAYCASHSGHLAPERLGSPGGEELMPLGPCPAHPLSGSGRCPQLTGTREAG